MKNSLGKSAVFNIIYQGLNVIFPLISATYVAKILSPDGIGQVVFVQNIVSYFTLIAALGIPTYGTREVAKCRDRQHLSILFSELFLINAISSGICLLIYGFWVSAFSQDNYLLYIICGLELVFNFINVDWFYRGKEDYVYIAVRSISVKLISLILLFLFVRDEQDCAVYALLICLANGCNYIFNIVCLHKFVGFTFHGLQLKKHIQPLISLLVCAVAASLYSKIDITMLGVFCGSTSVGLYSMAFKTISIATAVVASATGVFLPRISYSYEIDKKKFGEYVNIGLQIVILVAVPAMIGISMVSADLMTVLFGNAYTVAYSVIVILSALLLIKGVGDLLCYQVLVSAKKEKYFLVSYVVAAFTNVFLNWILIPRMNYNGAALASVISEFIVNVTLLKYVFQIVKPHLSVKYCIGILSALSVMVVIVSLLQSVITTPMLSLVISVGLGCTSYLLAVILLLKKDLIQIVHLLKS